MSQQQQWKPGDSETEAAMYSEKIIVHLELHIEHNCLLRRANKDIFKQNPQ